MPVDSQMKPFYISIKFIVVFHVEMLQQLHLPINSTLQTWEKLFETFQPLWYSQKQHQINFKLKRKHDWCLELISVMYKWNPGITSSFLPMPSSLGFNYDILVPACLSLNQTFAAQKTC